MDVRNRSLQLIILFGLVSLFGDMVYEGARSVNGPFLELLAANAATVGIIAGIGEFLGYALRLLSGYLSDKTKAYWLLTFVGYLLLASVPLLCLAGIWQFAAFFIVIERLGKAIRNPARDTILSQASAQIGTGFAFGLHEAMDQIGAVIGPLFFTAIFYFLGTRTAGIAAYQKGYALLWIPYVLVMVCLVVAYRRVPDPAALDTSARNNALPDSLSRVFWLYVVFTFAATAGFVNFILVAFHFKNKNVMSDALIPFLYAVAMGVDAVAALAIGKYYDSLKKKMKTHTAGLNALIIIPFCTALLPVFIFQGHPLLIVLGVCLWGVIMGIHETIMRSAIADLTSLRKRGTGYGIFNTAYGLAVLAGSVLMGFLYGRSLNLLIAAVFIFEAIAVSVFFLMRREVFRTAQTSS